MSESQRHHQFAVGLLVITGSALFAAACSDTFSGCRETRTCPKVAIGGETAIGGESAIGGETATGGTEAAIGGEVAVGGRGGGTTVGAGGAGGSAGESALCDDGDSFYDFNTEACVGYRDCRAGEYVAREGSANSDRECRPCPENSFSDTDNSVDCAEWTACPPGSGVSIEGSSTSDRTCDVCEAGSASAGHSAVCASCAPGTAATAGASSCARCPANTYSAGAASTCTKCAAGFSSPAGADSCTAACVSVSGMSSGTGVTNTPAGSALDTIDGSDASYYGYASSCSGSCGAGAIVTATYRLSTATTVEAVSLLAYAGGSMRYVKVAMEFADGSSHNIYDAQAAQQITLTVPGGPWADVAAIAVSVDAGGGSPSGGTGTVRLYETRIKAAGLQRLPKCL